MDGASSENELPVDVSACQCECTKWCCKKHGERPEGAMVMLGGIRIDRSYGELRELAAILDEDPKLHRHDAGLFMRMLLCMFAPTSFKVLKCSEAGSIPVLRAEKRCNVSEDDECKIFGPEEGTEKAFASKLFDGVSEKSRGEVSSLLESMSVGKFMQIYKEHVWPKGMCFVRE